MRKASFQSNLKRLADALPGFLFRHLSETVLLLYALVAIIFDNHFTGDNPCWVTAAYVIPFLFVAAFSLQFIRERHLLWQILYYILPLLIIPFFFVPSLEHFVKDGNYFIWVMVLLPLWMLLLPFRIPNRPFSNRMLHTAWSVLVPLFFGGVACLLLYLMEVSVELLFNVEGRWAYDDSAMVIMALLVPLLFLGMMENEREMKLAKFFENLLHWVFTPALLLYTLLLFLYAGYILFLWELPKGNVAVMVFVFCLIAMIVKLLRQFTEKQPFSWYFNAFSWISLPLLLLFWVGCIRRISDYGVTESRYYLLLCGLLMTLYVLLFLFRNRRGYFLLVGTAFLLVLAAVCIPPISAKACSIRSQEQRIRQTAAELGILNDDGTLKLGKPSVADSVYAKQHRIIYQSLEYLYDNKGNMEQFGIEFPSEYSATLSETTKDYVTSWREDDLIEATNHYTNFSVHFYDIKGGILMPVTGRYDSVYVSNNSVLPKNNDKSEKIYVKNNRLYFPCGFIHQDTLLHHQLRKCGWKEGDLINQDWLDKHIVDM
ncbi:MAG: DUF4153 domain-containing protein, partial [Bacteroidales bacterium]|nr:DUF4153 domain-containing protein [Bacteroidales bacterium]